jgi:hypothetical protein
MVIFKVLSSFFIGKSPTVLCLLLLSKSSLPFLSALPLLLPFNVPYLLVLTLYDEVTWVSKVEYLQKLKCFRVVIQSNEEFG